MIPPPELGYANTILLSLSRTPWQGDQPSSQEILEKGELNEEGYLNVGGAMGLPEERGTPNYDYLHRSSSSFPRVTDTSF